MNTFIRQTRNFMAAVMCFSLVFSVLANFQHWQVVTVTEAAAFAEGNIVVVRVGDGSAGLTTAAAPVFLDEYTTSGSLVQSLALPATASGGSGNGALTLAGSGSTEGALNRSPNGNYLTLAGYDASSGLAAVAGTSSATVNRIVGRIDVSGNIDTTTRAITGYSGVAIKSAVTDSGSRFWVGGVGGTRLIALGATTNTAIEGTSSRVASIYNAQLYTSTTTTPSVYKVGTGLPASSATLTNVTTPNSPPSPYAYILFGTDTLYVADDTPTASGGGIRKYRSTDGGSTFTFAYNLTGGGQLRGLTGFQLGTDAVLYATTATTTAVNNIVTVTDPIAQTSLGSQPSFTTIATSSTNTVFRGIARAPVAVTAAKMSEFTAKSEATKVVLGWKTGFEVNNLGFNIYRESRGKRIPLNQSIIAGSALMTAQGTAMTAGNSYSWVDPAGTSDSLYYLEDIDIDGTRTMHGPIVPSTGANSVATKSGRTVLLNELNAGAHQNTRSQRSQRGWAFSAGASSYANPLSVADIADSATRTVPPDSGSRLSRGETASNSQSQDKQKALAALPGLKLSVREDGWYRATQAALVAAGLNPNADMRYLQLYADGVEIPIVINSSKPTGPLKAGDSIEFYGVALDTPSADRREYWLVSGATLGKRIKAQVLKNISSGVLLPGFDYTVERKERLLYFSGLLNGDKENFFGQVLNSGPVAQTLSVQHLNSGTSSRLEVALQGVTLQDHVVSVLVNGTEVGVLNFNGQQNKVAQLFLGAGVLREGDNTVTLERTNGDMDISLVDYLRLNYAHTYQADNDVLQFTVTGRAQVRGFSTANVVLLDITDPNSVTLFNPKTEKGADGYNFTLQTSETRTFLALTDQKVGQLAALTRNQPSSWSTSVQGADFIIITHRNFRNSVEPLAQLRRNEGMSVAVVEVEDVYDEFSYGAHESRAIRDFLEWTQTHWRRAPRFVLLVGDGSFDPRNYLGNGETDILPAHLIDTVLLETVSDDWFVDFNNDGVGELALGRLPVRTAVEADTMISKIVNYSPANALQTAVMVADSMDAKTNFNFAAASDELGSLLPATIGVQKIYRVGNATSVVHDQVINGINQGPLLVNFMGHGSVEVWTGEPILSTDDAAALNNGARLPVFLIMTCLNGYYQNPARESLAESLLRTNAGGAVAVWASSGMTEPAPQFAMSTALYRQLLGSQPLTLGEAIRKAKSGNSDPDVRRTWILFGDPTMRVR